MAQNRPQNTLYYINLRPTPRTVPRTVPGICCKSKNPAMESSPRFPEQPSPCIASSHTTGPKRTPRLAHAQVEHTIYIFVYAHDYYVRGRVVLRRARLSRPAPAHLATSRPCVTSAPGQALPGRRRPPGQLNSAPGHVCMVEVELPGGVRVLRDVCGGMHCCSLLAVCAFGGGRTCAARPCRHTRSVVFARHSVFHVLTCFSRLTASLRLSC